MDAPPAVAASPERSPGPARRALALQGVAVASLLVAGFLIQLHFFRTYPQPVLFGDPQGYYVTGQKIRSGLARLRAGEGFAKAFEPVQGNAEFLGAGVLYATLDAVHPGDVRAFQLLLHAFNCLGMLGAYLLARRLSGSFLGGLAALLLSVAYPSYSVQTGRLYPDPVTSCLFVWSAFFYVAGLRSSGGRAMLAAGLLLGAGLWIRVQLMTPILVLLGLSLAAAAPHWWARREGRALVVTLLAGALPFVLAREATRLWVADEGVDAARGHFALHPLYPYGFWQFFETDGWEGPYRLRTEPFYKAMEEAAATDPELLESWSRQWLFTLGYVARRPWESALLVADNVYRLYDRPANAYRWDYPFDYEWQVVLQRAILLLALVGLIVFTHQDSRQLGVFLIPLSLALIHGLSFPLLRYGQAALPTLVAVAGAALAWVLGRLTRVPWRVPLRLLGVGTALFLLARAADAALPAGARSARVLATLVLLAAPFALAAGGLAPGRRRRILCAVAFGLVAVPTTAHALRDRLWHQTEIRLGDDVAGIEQEIFLSPEALVRIREAAEAYLVLDLTARRGELRARLRVGDRDVVPSLLVPTMPRLPEATDTGGRDARGYPQWWALPLTPDLLPRSAADPLRVSLIVGPGSSLRLRGDRFGEEQRVYEGPSFGDWPYLVPQKLEYDADYRIGRRMPLGSLRTRSFLLRGDGERRPASGVHRVRLVVLTPREGRCVWEGPPAPRSPRATYGFFAYSGRRGTAWLEADGHKVLEFPLGSPRDYEVAAGEWTLVHRAQAPRGGMAYGAYFLSGPVARPGARPAFAVRFRPGMSVEPMFFSLDARGELEAEYRALGPNGGTLVNGSPRLLDASRNNYPDDTGRWSVDTVY